MIFEVVKSITADLSLIPLAFKKVKEMKRKMEGAQKTLPSSKISGNITNICFDGIVVTLTYSIDNTLNCFFVSIGQKFAENFPNVSLYAQAYVTPEMSDPGFSLLSALSVRVA